VTRALQFNKAAGWDRGRAEQWVGQHLGLRDLGRTALLALSYRSEPLLARFLSDLVFRGAFQDNDAKSSAMFGSGKGLPPVEFVAVPGLGGLEARRPGDGDSHWQGGGTATAAPRLRTLRGGAGLEIDLADPARLELMPPELRAALPNLGLVNYLEARALVHFLEALVKDPAFHAEVNRWQAYRATWCERAGEVCDPCGDHRGHTSHSPAIGVMALYPTQVELLQLMIQSSSALKATSLGIEVGLPSRFHQRECYVALLSLTRSHSHRAVSYGDSPRALIQGLTRAVSRLIVFGDPGTLVRRSQWQGPLDHLDESGAQQERGLIGQLVRYLQGHGPHPQAFHLHESSRV
jgi:hypothetical protein